VEGEFLVRQLPILVEDGAAEHLFGRHPLLASVGTMGCGEILEDTVHDGGSGIEDIGDAPELFHDPVAVALKTTLSSRKE